MDWHTVLFCLCLLVLGLVVLWAVFFVISRIGAKTCPRCGEKWFTERTGEWAGIEDWHCIRCDFYWSIPYSLGPYGPRRNPDPRDRLGT